MMFLQFTDGFQTGLNVLSITSHIFSQANLVGRTVFQIIILESESFKDLIPNPILGNLVMKVQVFNCTKVFQTLFTWRAFQRRWQGRENLFHWTSHTRGCSAADASEGKGDRLALSMSMPSWLWFWNYYWLELNNSVLWVNKNRKNILWTSDEQICKSAICKFIS